MGGLGFRVYGVEAVALVLWKHVRSARGIDIKNVESFFNMLTSDKETQAGQTSWDFWAYGVGARV